jgi:hypothetical protein
MDKENMAYIHNRALCSHKERKNEIMFIRKRDGTGDHVK